MAAGISPGPLMTLVIAESLRGGWPAGFRVSLVPLLSDSVLVALALLATAPLPPWGLSAISVVGGCIMVWMGWSTIRAAAPAIAETAATGSAMFWKATATNVTNPHAILFWLTIGGPNLKEAYNGAGLTGPIAFMTAFFAAMISAKMAVSFGVSTSRRFLQGPGYRYTLGAAGGLLAMLGVWQLFEGVRGISF